MRKRHILMNDAAWEAQKLRMRENTELSLLNGEYGFASRAKVKTLVVTTDPDGCPTFCPECHGENMTIANDNGTDYALPCTRYEARKAAKNGA